MKAGSLLVAWLVTAIATMGLVLASCSQQKTLSNVSSFSFQISVSPDTGPVGTAFQYDIGIEIQTAGATVNNLMVSMSVPKTLALVEGGASGPSLNGRPVLIQGQQDNGATIVYSFALGDLSVSPSDFHFECQGVQAADSQKVYATLQADGTTAPSVVEQVTIEGP